MLHVAGSIPRISMFTYQLVGITFNGITQTELKICFLTCRDT